MPRWMGTSRGADAWIGHSAPTNLKGERAMNIQLSRVAMSIFVVVAIALLPGPSWAIYYGLGQSNDEWGLKYDVEVNEADRDTLTVVFTLADEGRLKPFYSLQSSSNRPKMAGAWDKYRYARNLPTVPRFGSLPIWSTASHKHQV